MKYLDQLKRTIELHKPPKRIVSLVPSQTELLVDLGLESSVVGITKFCIHPNHLRQEKQVVGGTKQVHYNKIEALNPDIILCNKEENTKAMILALERIAPVHVSDIYTIDDALELVEQYGTLFSVEKKAEDLIQSIKKSQQNFSKFVLEQPKRNVVYFIWKDPWMVAANETFIDSMLRINNFDNYFSHLQRYPEIELDMVDASADIIMLSSEPFPFKNKHVEALREKFPNTTIILVDGEYFSWYGSRLKDAFSYFRKLHQQF